MSTKKYLDLDGLSHVWLLIGNKLATKVDKEYKTGSSSVYKVLSDNNYTDAEVTKLSGIEAGAEANVIETVQVNGTALTPSSKTVNVEIPITSVKVNGTALTPTSNAVDVSVPITSVKVNGSALTPSNYAVDVTVPITSVKVNGSALTPSNNAVDITVPTKVSDLTNDGDGTAGSEFATKDYVDANGGKIDTIEVNGVAQTITNKTVDITVPTNNNQLTNGAGYQTASDVSTAIDAKISSTYKAKGSCTFANKPSLASSHEGEVWNISDGFTTTSDFVEGAGSTYPAGTNIVVVNTGTSQSPTWKYDVLAGFIDLSSYLTSSDVIALTNSEIDSVCT